MGKQSKVEKAIRAARKRLDAGEYIGAVKAVRERYPERGLKGAKDFTDWVRSNDEENATDLAGTWCEECWDILPCRIGVNHARPAKTKPHHSQRISRRSASAATRHARTRGTAWRGGWSNRATTRSYKRGCVARMSRASRSSGGSSDQREHT